MRIFKNQFGASLIELQIAAVISLLIGGISFFTLFRCQSAYIMGEKMADLHYRGRMSMDRMVDDIRLAGYGLAVGDTAFLSAQEDELTMKADLDDDGVVDKVRFYLSDPSTLPETPNPNDGILHKSLNESPPGIRIGSSFTTLTFGFFDENGNDLLSGAGPIQMVDPSNLHLIRFITVSLTAEMQKPDKEGAYRILVLNSSINPRNPIILASDQ